MKCTLEKTLSAMNLMNIIASMLPCWILNNLVILLIYCLFRRTLDIFETAIVFSLYATLFLCTMYINNR